MISTSRALGAGLPTPPWARPKVSLNWRKSLFLETFGQTSCGVGRPAHSEDPRITKSGSLLGVLPTAGVMIKSMLGVPGVRMQRVR